MSGCIGSSTPTLPEEQTELLGTAEVGVTTTGANPDPDGYQLTIDEDASQPVATSGSVTFTGLRAGTYQVTLTGEADNCSVGPSNPQTFNVPAGGTVTVAFQVDCP